MRVKNKVDITIIATTNEKSCSCYMAQVIEKVRDKLFQAAQEISGDHQHGDKQVNIQVIM